MKAKEFKILYTYPNTRETCIKGLGNALELSRKYIARAIDAYMAQGEEIVLKERLLPDYRIEYHVNDELVVAVFPVYTWKELR